MDTKKLVVGQKVWLRHGGLIGEPTEPAEATVREVGEYLTLEVHLPPDPNDKYNTKWGVVFKNGKQWGGIWKILDGKAAYECDRRFKVVFEEGEHTKPHRFTLDSEL